MQKKHKILKRIGLFCIALLLVIIAWGGLVSAPASSQRLDSRLNALEVDRNRIESRLNRIEGQLNQLVRSGSRGTPAAPSPNNSGRNRPPQLDREQMFDRLATLAIELKEQITKLEARVSKLESRRTPRTTP